MDSTNPTAQSTPAKPAPHAPATDARLDAILEAAVEGIVITDDQGRIELFSRSAEQIFGYGRDEVAGRNVSILMTDADSSEHDGHMERYKATGVGKIMGIGREVTGRRRDGSVFPMDLSVGEFRGVDGERRFIGIIRDVTERKEMEELLRQREELVRLTFENAPLAIATTDLSGRFIRVNRAFCEMLGYTSEEMAEKTFRDVTHPADMEVSAAQVNRMASGEITSYTLRKRYMRKDGQEVHAHLHCGLVHDVDNQPRMIIAQVEDQTERLRTEEELRLHRERLTHVARVSTMGEMASGIAHEVNQPLTAIATYAEACRRMILGGMAGDPELPETLTQIANEAIRAGEIIHRLRNLVKKQRGKRGERQIDKLIRDVAQLAEADMHLHGMHLRLELAGNLPPVSVDEIQIQQVVLNLIRNGIDAMEGQGGDGENEIVVKTSMGSDADVEVAVVDRGTGFPEGAGAEYLQPFFTTKEGGMGLGLSISHSIVTAHGGRLWFSRNEDRGSTVTFTLPARVGGVYETEGS